jgi:hypothetical protein
VAVSGQVEKLSKELRTKNKSVSQDAAGFISLPRVISRKVALSTARDVIIPKADL